VTELVWQKKCPNCGALRFLSAQKPLDKVKADLSSSAGEFVNSYAVDSSQLPKDRTCSRLLILPFRCFLLDDHLQMRGHVLVQLHWN
jgi:hypothetical protein